MIQNGIEDTEQRHGYAELTSLTALNAERLKTLLETTHEIKEQLVIMNGRVRDNEKGLVAITANPPLTRDHCDKQRGNLDERIRMLEGSVPSIIQNVVIALVTGSMMGIIGYFLSRVP